MGPSPAKLKTRTFANRRYPLGAGTGRDHLDGPRDVGAAAPARRTGLRRGVADELLRGTPGGGAGSQGREWAAAWRRTGLLHGATDERQLTAPPSSTLPSEPSPAPRRHHPTHSSDGSSRSPHDAPPSLQRHDPVGSARRRGHEPHCATARNILPTGARGGGRATAALHGGRATVRGAADGRRRTGPTDGWGAQLPGAAR